MSDSPTPAEQVQLDKLERSSRFNLKLVVVAVTCLVSGFAAAYFDPLVEAGVLLMISGGIVGLFAGLSNFNNAYLQRCPRCAARRVYWNAVCSQCNLKFYPATEEHADSELR